MNRRGFIKAAAALSVTVPAEELAAGVERSFDPTEHTIASLQACCSRWLEHTSARPMRACRPVS